MDVAIIHIYVLYYIQHSRGLITKVEGALSTEVFNGSAVHTISTSTSLELGIYVELLNGLRRFDENGTNIPLTFNGNVQFVTFKTRQQDNATAFLRP